MSKLQTVELKHHEFEQLPLEEDIELETGVEMSEPIEDKKLQLEEKKKKKKKKVNKSILFIFIYSNPKN